MNTSFDFTPMMIKCPACDMVQSAIAEHTVPFGTFIHNCQRALDRTFNNLSNQFNWQSND